jgi:NAD(P)-dependent dehydrogenase (short-subunit alcohol dehydrogenase family)
MSNIKTDKKIAFITGANRGIGFETAKQLGQLGIFPVIGVRSETAGKEAIAKLTQEGIEADFIIFDVTKRDDLKTAYNYFDKYGRLDILINNAGKFLEGEPGVEKNYTAANLPEQILRDTMEANFFGVVATTQALLPLIQKSKSGRIVNLASILGSLTLHADPASPIYSMKSFAYDASKTIVNAYTVQLAFALKDSAVKVNSAHPGWVQTEMGGSAAPMSIVDGAKTSVLLATLPDNGPTGGFFHMNESLPW